VLVLSRAQVESLLDLDTMIDALAPAMADLSAGRASVPDRIAATVPEHDALLAAMPGFVPSCGVLAAKLVTLFPHNASGTLPTHQAVIVVFDSSTGEPTALVDGTAITAARTAACSALSARLLANPEASVLAVIGTGVQARWHARALCRVRPIRELRVAGRDPAKAAVLAATLRQELSSAGHTAHLDVRAVASYAEALAGADIASACTHATEPVVRREWLSAGVHVTSVGFNGAGREVDAATVADALLCVESRRAALAPYPAGSNDLLWPIRDGQITAEHVHAELGELVTGARHGRQSPEQVTLYKSVGVAVQDAAAAATVMAAASAAGLGHTIAI
jgi:alanine dehydrogenase